VSKRKKCIASGSMTSGRNFGVSPYELITRVALGGTWIPEPPSVSDGAPSRTVTLWPFRASPIAAPSPASPAPTMIISSWCTGAIVQLKTNIFVKVLVLEALRVDEEKSNLLT